MRTPPLAESPFPHSAVWAPQFPISLARYPGSPMTPSLDSSGTLVMTGFPPPALVLLFHWKTPEPWSLPHVPSQAWAFPPNHLLDPSLPHIPDPSSLSLFPSSSQDSPGFRPLPLDGQSQVPATALAHTPVSRSHHYISTRCLRPVVLRVWAPDWQHWRPLETRQKCTFFGPPQSS